MSKIFIRLILALSMAINFSTFGETGLNKKDLYTIGESYVPIVVTVDEIPRSAWTRFLHIH